MTAEGFTGQRRSAWQELEALVEQTNLGPADRRRLGALYRAALADLGLLRTLAARQEDGGAAPAALPWLNSIVARAHARIAHSRRGPGANVFGFVNETFPRAVRRAGGRILFATFFLVASGLTAYLLCRSDVALARLLVGPAMSRNAESFAEMGKGRDESQDSVMAAFYVTNNIRVAFVAFALGITFGVGTIWIMIQNGLLLGVTLALVIHEGVVRNFLGFVASHGFIEMGAIVIAAGAGLGMGRALIAPGPHGRGFALKSAARESATLVTGAACLLLLAAFFEAFVSPSSWSVTTKAIIGSVNACWLLAYLLLAGRDRSDERLPATPA